MLDSTGNTPGAVWDLLAYIGVSLGKMHLKEQLLSDLGGDPTRSLDWGVTVLLNFKSHIPPLF